MYISKTVRKIIKGKFGGKCAYTGTDLADDWQIDHVKPIVRNWLNSNKATFIENHNIENMLPCQRLVNHYKHSMQLETFREFMKDFHLRVAKLPKNPKTTKSIKRKAYMLEVAKLFAITPDKPFSGTFFFESINTIPNE